MAVQLWQKEFYSIDPRSDAVTDDKTRLPMPAVADQDLQQASDRVIDSRIVAQAYDVKNG